jgi:hypothetical protein
MARSDSAEGNMVLTGWFRCRMSDRAQRSGQRPDNSSMTAAANSGTMIS